MAPIETSDERAGERPTAVEEAARFTDLWAISDAEIAAGMRTLDLDEIVEETARRRGR